MRQPQDFQITMNGLWSAELMGGIQYTMDGVYSSLNKQNWGPFGFVKNAILQILDDFLLWVFNRMFPGAPGSIDWLTAGPEALADVAGTTATTLVQMQAQRRWLQYTWIPAVQQVDWARMDGYYWANRNLAYQLYGYAINALSGAVNSIYTYLGAEVAYLTAQINTAEGVALAYTRSVYAVLVDTVNRVVVAANNRMDALHANEIAFTTQVRDNAAHALSLAKVELAAAITALGLWLTTTYIPGAFLAYTELTIAQIAAGMDLLWPMVFRNVEVTALKLLGTLPLVSARALDVPPEPVPGVGGLAEATAAALGFTTAVQASACAPMWDKLHQFADDTAELDGLVTTVLLGGLVAAMVAAPEATAAGIADAVAGPLNEAAVSVLSLVGL